MAAPLLLVVTAAQCLVGSSKLHSPCPGSRKLTAVAGFLTSEERHQGRIKQLSASRQGLLKLLTSRTGIHILRQLSETPCGGRLLYDRVVKGLTENSLNVNAQRLQSQKMLQPCTLDVCLADVHILEPIS